LEKFCEPFDFFLYGWSLRLFDPTPPSGATKLVSDKGRANCEAREECFVIGLYVHVWTFGYKRMGYCLLPNMVLDKKKVFEIVRRC
jgi:hypothetical protein